MVFDCGRSQRLGEVGLAGQLLAHRLLDGALDDGLLLGLDPLELGLLLLVLHHRRRQDDDRPLSWPTLHLLCQARLHRHMVAAEAPPILRVDGWPRLRRGILPLVSVQMC